MNRERMLYLLATVTGLAMIAWAVTTPGGHHASVSFVGGLVAGFSLVSLVKSYDD